MPNVLLLPPPSRPDVDLPTMALDLVALLHYRPDVPYIPADYPAPLALPVMRLWAGWLETELAASTATRYRRDLEQFARWVQRVYLVANPEELTAGILARWYLALVRECRAGVITEATLARKVTTLQRAIRRAEKDGTLRAGLGAVEVPVVPPPVEQVTMVLDGREWLN